MPKHSKVMERVHSDCTRKSECQCDIARYSVVSIGVSSNAVRHGDLASSDS